MWALSSPSHSSVTKLLEATHKHWLHYKSFAVEGQDVLRDINKYVHSREYNTDTGNLIITMLCNAFKVPKSIDVKMVKFQL